MTSQELAVWCQDFKARLAETDEILRDLEAQCARLAAVLEARNAYRHV